MADNKIILEVEVNAANARRSIAEIKADLAAAKQATELAAGGTSDFNQALSAQIAFNKELKEAMQPVDQAFGKQRKSLGGINENFNFVNASLGQLFQYQKQLKNEILVPERDSQQVADLSAELRKVNSEIKQFQDSVKGVQAVKIPDPFTNLDENKIPLDQLKALRTVLTQTTSAIAPGSDEYEKYAAQLRKVNEVIRTQQRELSGAIPLEQQFVNALQKADVATNETVKSISQLEDALKELKNVQKSVDVGSEEFKKTTAAIGKLEAELKSVRSEATATGEKLGGALGGIQKTIDGIGGSLKQIPTLLLAAFSLDAIKNFVGEIATAVKEFDQLRNKIGLITGQSGEALSKTTANVSAIAKTFGEDSAKVFQSANALAKNFGISFDDALKKIETGFLSGANANEDFLDIIKEYPAQLKAAGLSAQETINIITQTQKEGIFSDKGIDAIKEAGLRLREGADGTRDAIAKAFGAPFAKDILTRIKDGKTTTLEAIKELTDKAGKAALSVSQKQTLISDLFGGAGEDAGEKFVFALGETITKAQQLAQVSDEFAKNVTSNVTKLGETLANKLGKSFSTELVQQIQSGEISTESALARIQARSQELGLTQKETSAIFAQILPASAKTQADAFASSVDNIVKSVSQQRIVQENALTAQRQYQQSLAELSQALGGAGTDFETLKTKILATVIEGIANFVNTIKTIPKFLDENKGYFIALGVAIAGLNFGAIAANVRNLVAAFNLMRASTIATTVAQAALNVVMRANPIGLIITAIAALGAGLLYLYNNFDTVRGVINAAWEVISGVANYIFDFAIGAFDALGKTVVGLFTLDFDLLSEGVQKAVDTAIEGGKNIQQTAKNAAAAYNKEVNGSNSQAAQARVQAATAASAKNKQIAFDEATTIVKLNRLKTDELKKLEQEATKNNFSEAQKRIKGVLAQREKEAAEREKAASAEGQAAAEAYKAALEASKELRLKARVELAGGEKVLSGIDELYKQAVEKEKKQQGFSLLNKKEQDALLLIIERQFQEKRAELILGALKDTEARVAELDARGDATRKANQEAALLEIAKLEQESLSNYQLTSAERERIQIEFSTRRIEAARATAKLELDVELAKLETQRELQRADYEANLKILNENLRLKVISEDLYAKELQRLNAKNFNKNEALRIQELNANTEYNKKLLDADKTRLDNEAKLRELEATALKEQLELKLELAKKGSDTTEQLVAIEEYYANEIALAKGNALAIEKIETQKAAAVKEVFAKKLENSQFKSLSVRLDAIHDYYNNEQLAAKDNAEKLLAIEKQKQSAIANAYLQTFNKISEVYNKSSEVVNSVVDTVSAAQTKQVDNQIAENERAIQATNDRISQLESTEEGATGIAKEKLQKRVAIEKDAAKKQAETARNLAQEKANAEKTAGQIKKAISIGQIIIDTARAIMESVAASPLTGGLPFSAIAAALGAAQLAAVIATEFAQGGHIEGGFASGGVFKGASHANGGIKFAFGGLAGEAEGGEIILAKGVYADPGKRAVASALNASVGGRSFADGGVIGGVKFGQDLIANVKIDNSQLIEAIQAIPAPVVEITEINRVQKKVAKIEERAKF